VYLSTVAPDTAVDLVLSFRPAPVTVPDVTGLAQAIAKADIVAADLVIGAVTSDNSDTVPDDPRDLNADGEIDGLHARVLVRLCTRPRCATE
jgi:hypothetical protein